MTHETARSIYRKLLRILPDNFRWRHGSEMEQVFIEALDDAVVRPRLLGKPRVWLSAIHDVFVIAVESRWPRGTKAVRVSPTRDTDSQRPTKGAQVRRSARSTTPPPG